MKRAVLGLCAVVLAFALASHFRSRPKPAELLGLWASGTPREVADEVRFYYFHEGGKGLYRYGQLGHNQTNSFDWSLDGDQLVLVFRKTGEGARTQILLVEEQGQRALTLVNDPRGPGRGRYVRRPSQLALDPSELGGPLSLPGVPSSSSSSSSSSPSSVTADRAALAGWIWMDARHYATGGMGFVMYQLSNHPLGDGMKLGWHHRGDFDDWSTETLAYRQESRALRLRFALRGEEAVTPAELPDPREVVRVLTLARDPRNFLHSTRLREAGRSF